MKTKIGRANQINSSEIKPSGQFPVIDQGRAYIAGYSDEELKVIKDELPVIVFGDHTRCIKYIDFPFILGGDGTKVIKTNEELFYPKFYYFALLNLDIPSRGYNRHFTLLKEREIPRPEFTEQKKIAYVLSMVQKAIEQQEQLIEVATELKKALMHKFFTEGLCGEPQKQTEIGPMPESWVWVKIGNFGKVVTGTTPKTSIPEYYNPPEVDFIAPADLGQTRQVYESEKKISQRGFDAIRGLPKDTVLCVCIGSSIGKVGMTAKDVSATNQQINAIICNDQHDPKFIYYLLSHFSGYWRNFATFGPVPILNKNRFETIDIIGPYDRGEEEEIGQQLSAVDTKIELHMHRKVLLTDLLHTLLHQLMTAQIRVNDLGELESITSKGV